ncbi:hypothetical protein [Amycolatopsis coloradensis]|uniref:hypothetical protein n=1 Tax=Amycolatopsis coloradensis TaxID=76021 RepID=UPI001177962C|nr:hypothetical protein [Amycolatopsis coloradensis]
MILDEKQGRQTPEIVKEIASSVPGHEILKFEPETPDKSNAPKGTSGGEPDQRAELLEFLQELAEGQPTIVEALQEGFDAPSPVIVFDLAKPGKHFLFETKELSRLRRRVRQDGLIWLPHEIQADVVGPSGESVHIKTRREQIAEAFAKYWLEHEEAGKKPGER